MKNTREIENILANIDKNVSNKKWKCIIDGCEECAINSHIYQKNGILSNIAEDSHLMEVKPIDVFKWDNKKFNEISAFKKIGITQAFSYPTLCNSHDTSIFLGIEKHPIELTNYNNQLLFFYRTLLSSKRKIQIVIETQTRITQSNIIKANVYCESIIRKSLHHIELMNKNIIEYDKEINKIEYDLLNNYCNFTIHKFEYHLIKAYGMSIIFNPTSKSFLYINIFPYNGKSIVLVGSFTDNIDSWIQKNFDMWDNLNSQEFEVQLTTYLSKNSENWGISPKIEKNIKKDDLMKFFSLKAQVMKEAADFNGKIMLDLDYRTDYNFFSDGNYGY